MFDRFTDRARKVMTLARQEAGRLNNDYIGTEHILLGLLDEGSSTAANVIENLDVDLTVVRAEIDKLVTPAVDVIIMGQLPFTPRAKKVLEFAIDEAREFRHNHVGSEHLLLGLIREKECLAAQALQKLNLTYEIVRAEVLEFLGAKVPEPGVETGSSPARTPPTPGLFDHFSDRARKAMSLARQEAGRLNHDYIGTEHILLGLVREGSGTAAHVLDNLDIDLEQIRREVEKLVKPAPDVVTMGQLPFTPRAKQALEYAIDEARVLEHTYVGTEHLLLGLIREEEGLAAQVLRNLHLTLEDVRIEVLEYLGAVNAEPRAEQRVIPETQPVEPSRSPEEVIQPEIPPVVPQPEPPARPVVVEAVYRGKISAWASALLMVSGGMLIGSSALALMFATRAESQLLSFFLLGLLLVFVGVVIGPWRAR